MMTGVLLNWDAGREGVFYLMNYVMDSSWATGKVRLPSDNLYGSVLRRILLA